MGQVQSLRRRRASLMPIVFALGEGRPRPQPWKRAEQALEMRLKISSTVCRRRQSVQKV
jgi:hypothetical protein